MAKTGVATSAHRFYFFIMSNPKQLPFPPPADPVCQGTFVVGRLAGAGLLTNVQVGQHQHEFWADGTTDQGGQNLGPAPYDLLLAALATCAAMTVRQYACRRGWALHYVGIHLAYHMWPEVEVAGSRLPEQLEQRVELTGNLTEKQRQSLRNAAATCPVALILEPGIYIETILA
jgi:putative redox protein